MLYDVAPPTNQPLHARAALLRIYTLGDGGGGAGGGGGEEGVGSAQGAWMEHHYFFTARDLQERPRWAAHLAARPLEDEEGELLLSAGLYRSPLALVTGEFGVRYERARRGGGGAALRPRRAPPLAPTFVCRRAFDAATACGSSLRRALAGFEG